MQSINKCIQIKSAGDQKLNINGAVNLKMEEKNIHHFNGAASQIIISATGNLISTNSDTILKIIQGYALVNEQPSK
jgi:hypothetical protein